MFSNPDVIARIKNDFIPVALKAGKVMNPPAGLEGALYREFKRTQPAPQGICVANSAGKPLSWTLMFEDDPSVLKFLDHAQQRFRTFPDGSKAFATERFMRFPKHKLADAPDSGTLLNVPDGHAESEQCPGDLPFGENSLLAKVVGRALGSDGAPLSDARTQDNYVEDRFEIPEAMQRAFLNAAKDADGDECRVPAELARLIAANAYLGMLDVNPLGGHYSGGETTTEHLNLWAKRLSESTFLLWGTSSVAATQAPDRRADDGRVWEHKVDLVWRGYLETGGSGFRELSLIADGDEVLRWGNRNQDTSARPAVANLPGGKPIHFSGRVRYGILAK